MQLKVERDGVEITADVASVVLRPAGEFMTVRCHPHPANRGANQDTWAINLSTRGSGNPMIYGGQEVYELSFIVRGALEYDNLLSAFAVLAAMGRRADAERQTCR
jgi:hypothetical protein